jgi:hypothetical protein
VSSCVGPSGCWSCSVSAVRNSFIVLSESEFKGAGAMVFPTLSLDVRRGGHLFLEYLGSTTHSLDNPGLVAFARSAFLSRLRNGARVFSAFL